MLFFTCLLLVFPRLVPFISVLSGIPEDQNGLILGFWGSIIGGLFTLGGVLLSNLNENRSKSLEMIIQYRPILSADVVNWNETNQKVFSGITIGEIDTWADVDKGGFIPQAIKISNVGRGEVSKSRYEIVSFNVRSELEKTYTHIEAPSPYLTDTGDIGYLPVGESTFIRIQKPFCHSDRYEIKNPKSVIELAFTMKLAIWGPFGNDEQRYLLSFKLCVFLKDNVKTYAVRELSFTREEIKAKGNG